MGFVLLLRVQMSTLSNIAYSFHYALPAHICMLCPISLWVAFFFAFSFHSENRVKGLDAKRRDLILLQFCISVQRGQGSSFFLLPFGPLSIFVGGRWTRCTSFSLLSTCLHRDTAFPYQPSVLS